MEPQSLYQDVIKFATAKHIAMEQTVPGTDLPYVVHLSNVAMEVILASFHTPDFNLGFAIQVALLHDTIEDTATTFDELKDRFGVDVALAVSALSKNPDIPKESQMMDSLLRIKKLQPEVWAVKLADRITNLQDPPSSWYSDKIKKYFNEAGLILNELEEGNEFLAKRLNMKMVEYASFIRDQMI
jgi:(p)ppGpp synthase/HD superfamily hydrolase